LKIAGYEIDKSLAASVALHVGVIGWGLVSFSTRSLDAKPQEALPVDIISSEQLSQITKGTKNGQKENSKPLVEKQGESKPIDEPVGKVTEKKEVIAASEKPPEPKPPEKKPEPPKPVEKKPEPPVDQIAEALKKDQAKKPVEKKETKAEPKKDEKPKKERTFDQSKIAALLDKRDPTRQAAVGDVINPNSSFGTAAGQAQKLTMSWIGALQARIKQCWIVPAGVRDAENIEIRVYFELRKDGTVANQPRLLAGPPSASGPAIAESAIRAIQQCQPYSFLPPAEYVGGWDRLDITFSSKDLFR
jgi:outer membrane biosynthesis protein TonB